jgi:hypothetical protein
MPQKEEFVALVPLGVSPDQPARPANTSGDIRTVGPSDQVERPDPGEPATRQRISDAG